MRYLVVHGDSLIATHPYLVKPARVLSDLECKQTYSGRRNARTAGQKEMINGISKTKFKMLGEGQSEQCPRSRNLAWATMVEISEA